MDSVVFFILILFGSVSCAVHSSYKTSYSQGIWSSIWGEFDINNDGVDDIALIDPGNTRIIFLRGDPLGLVDTDKIYFNYNLTNFPTQAVLVADFNNDTILDVVAGNGSTVFVFYGNSTVTLPDTIPDWEFSDPDALSGVGFDLDVGDFDGDGFKDLVVGSPLALSEAGHTFIFFGGPTGLNQNVNYTMSYTSNSKFGAFFAVAKFNNDKYDDLIVSAFQSSTVLYYHGRPDRSFTLKFTYSINNTFGYSVAAADVNCDGHKDFVVSSRDEATVRVYFGNSSGLPLTTAQNQILDFRPTRTSIGDQVVNVGDMDGDGCEDVIITAQDYLEVYLYLGSPTGLSSSPFYIDNSTVNLFGIAACAAGDIDYDGIRDFVVGGTDEIYVFTNHGLAKASPSPTPSPSPSPSQAPTPSKTPTPSGIPSPTASSSPNLTSSPSHSPAGQTVSASSTPDSNSSKRGSKNSSVVVGAVLGALLGAVVLAAIIGFIVFNRKKKNEEQKEKHDAIAMIRMSSSHNDDKRWEIDYDDLDIGNEIGRGAFGVVYKAKWRNVDCVVKQLNINSKDQSAVSTFLKEANTVKNLKFHPNVCTINGVCTKPDHPICIVMEWVPGGSLQSLIFSDKLKLDKLTVARLAKDICIGMDHIHREGILHCDLACRNLLVDHQSDKLLVKVTDFGLARNAESGTYTASSQAVFPIRWSAPEVLTRQQISRASDVWSFGVTLWEIMEGVTPYVGKTNAEVVDYVRAGNILPRPKGETYPIEIYEIMKQCWKMDPSERPSFGDLVKTFSELERKYESELGIQTQKEPEAIITSNHSTSQNKQTEPYLNATQIENLTHEYHSASALALGNTPTVYGNQNPQ